MKFSRPPPRPGNPQSKAEKSAEAKDVVAAFLAAGGRVKQMPTVEPVAFACANCGHTGVMGVTEGKVRKCPRCREPLP